jgi:hypothetical protein
VRRKCRKSMARSVLCSAALRPVEMTRGVKLDRLVALDDDLDVGLAPNATIGDGCAARPAIATSRRLFDYLVGTAEHHRRDCDADGLGRIDIDDEVEFGRLDDRQVRRLGALEDAPGIDPNLAVSITEAGAIAHEPAGRRKVGKRIDTRHLVSRGKGCDLTAAVYKEAVSSDHYDVGVEFADLSEYSIQILRAARREPVRSETELTARRLDRSHFRLGTGKVWIDDHRHRVGVRQELSGKFQPLHRDLCGDKARSSEISARSAEARDETAAHGVRTAGEDYWDNLRRLFCGLRCVVSAGGYHINLMTHQIVGQRRQSVVVPLRPAVLDPDILTLDIAGFLKALANRRRKMPEGPGRCIVEEAHDGKGWPLRPSRNWRRKTRAE